MEHSSPVGSFQIIAFITMEKERVLTGQQLTLLAKNQEEQKAMTLDIARALKADVVQMKSGDYLVVR